MSSETKNKIVPRLRFPEFKEDGEWEEKTMESISERVDQKVEKLKYPWKKSRKTAST